MKVRFIEAAFSIVEGSKSSVTVLVCVWLVESHDWEGVMCNNFGISLLLFNHPCYLGIKVQGKR